MSELPRATKCIDPDVLEDLEDDNPVLVDDNGDGDDLEDTILVETGNKDDNPVVIAENTQDTQDTQETEYVKEEEEPEESMYTIQ